MATLQQTFGSGSKFEQQLTAVITKYTRHIWRNIRIETLLTQQGTTEIDILFCYKNLIFSLEAKNVGSIFGDYNSRNWSFVGSKAPMREVKEYSALNTLTQNNIHVRSFKDCFYAYFKYWPTVVPIIVVPNDCTVSPNIADSIFTIGQLDNFLAEANSWEVESTLHRLVASMIPGDGVTVLRPDFVLNNAKGIRVKMEGGGS